jgi:hypothetical protein
MIFAVIFLCVLLFRASPYFYATRTREPVVFSKPHAAAPSSCADFNDPVAADMTWPCREVLTHFELCGVFDEHKWGQGCMSVYCVGHDDVYYGPLEWHQHGTRIRPRLPPHFFDPACHFSAAAGGFFYAS